MRNAKSSKDKTIANRVKARQSERGAVGLGSRLLLSVLGFASAVSLGLTTANATPVTATLSATYFEVCDSCNPPDFGGSGTPNVAPGSALGPNGFPVVSSPFGISDVDPTTHEITWWSPALNSKIVETGTGTISLPYASNMYAPNSTGTNDASFFETAFFRGDFTLSSTESVEFQLGSDDDSFIYVDGVLIGDNPGIHGVTNVDFTASDLAAGTHTIEVFYDDRERVGAFLSLSLLTSGVVITPPPSVPEPAPLGLMAVGLLALVAVRARKRSDA
jgi:hypothetical protein